MGGIPWKKICGALEAIECEPAAASMLGRTLEQLDHVIAGDHSLAVQMDLRDLPHPQEFISWHPPVLIWENYLAHFSSVDSHHSAAAFMSIPKVSGNDFKGEFETEFGRDFLLKYDMRFCLALGNFALTGGRGFFIGLYRGIRAPFSEREVVIAQSIFPHLHNLFLAVARPSEYRERCCRKVAAASGLSQREQDVAVLLTDRLSTAEIADRLFISRHTVEKHVEHIYLKLKANGKREARMLLLGEHPALQEPPWRQRIAEQAQL